MKVGDIYYSDGAMTHQSEALASGKTPIGIVGYIGSDYWTEKGVVISGKPVGGHALVMCLKTIGSTGSTVEAQEDYIINKDNGAKVKAYIGTRYAWYSSNSDTGRKPFVDSKDLIVNSNNQTYGSGYTDTNYLINKWGVAAAAAYWAKNYKELPAPSAKCTGWFLPSAGQYYAALSQLGGGGMSSDWSFYTFINVTTKINDMLEKVGGSNYTYFFQKGYIWTWTSSEYSSDGAVFVTSGVDDSKGSGSVRFYYIGKTVQVPVRPFLAF